MSLLDQLLARFNPTAEEIVQANAMYALRDMHIDASIADDMGTATLANLLIRPTDGELGWIEWTAEDYDALNY